MRSEIKSVVIIVIVTAIIIVVGLALTKSGPAPTSIVINKDTLVSTTTPMIYGLKVPAAQAVTVVEFGDFACPACAVLSPNIDQMTKDFDGYINYGIRLIPIHGEISYKSAVAAFAAGKQGKFFEMGSRLFEKQDEWTKPNADTATLFATYATEVGVKDLAMFKADLASETFNKVIRQMVDRDAEHARGMHIDSTPTLIINGETIVQGVSTYASLKDKIQDALDAAKNATTSAVITPGVPNTSGSATPANN